MSDPERLAESTNEGEYVWPRVNPAHAALVAEVLTGWQRHERPGQENLPPELIAEALHLWARASSHAAAALALHAESIRGFREGWGPVPEQPADTATNQPTDFPTPNTQP